jgi:hypothetical protein
MTAAPCGLEELQQADKDNYQYGYHVDAVSNLVAGSPGAHQVSLTWDPSNIHNENSFLIEWQDQCAGQWVPVAWIAQNAPSSLFLNHQSAGMQSYRVLGLGTPSANAGGRGDPAYVTVDVGQLLGPPITLASSFPSTTVNRISWSSVPGAAYYKVRTDISPTGSFLNCSAEIYGTQYNPAVPAIPGVAYYNKVMACDSYDACSLMTTHYTYSQRIDVGDWDYAFTYYRLGGNVSLQFINFNPNFMALKLHIRNGDSTGSPLVTSSSCIPGIPYGTIGSVKPIAASTFTTGKLGVQGHGVASVDTCATGEGSDSSTVGWGYVPPAGAAGPTPENGLWDVEVGPGLFHCIARTDQNPATLALGATAQCYGETDTAFAGSEPPCAAVHTTGGGPTPVVSGEGNCGGHASPPPYTTLPPVVFTGVYNPLTPPVSYTGCFANVGGTMGPNVIVQFSGWGASATAKVYTGQTNANCSARTPIGSSPVYTATMTSANPQARLRRRRLQ